MRHDCQATEESLVELLFGEVEGGAREALLEEVVRCERCAARYRGMAETLRVFDEAAETSLPAESFWDGYEERLRRRMAQEIRTDFWGRPEFARGEYRLTFVEDEGLTRRLVRELKAVGREAGLTLPEFKRDPFGFVGRSVEAYGRAGWAFFSQRNVALATTSAFVFVTLLLGTVFALERMRARYVASANPYVNLEVIGYVENEIPKEQPQPDRGPAGTNEGRGGGSKPKYEKPGGGGGGGRQEQTQASAGKLPPAQLDQPPINPPSPKPPVMNAHLPVPSIIQADPALIKADDRPLPYGDPRSTASTPSSGSGKGGGIGEGTGGGVGSGDGTGYGPGRGYNTGGGDAREGGGGPGGSGGGVDYSRPFKSDEVTSRAVITYKPEPGFTEEARKNNVTGTVRLRAVLSANGAVTNITIIKGLPDGLTEKAIAASRQIKFRPAQKDGRSVSQYVVLEYNFNIY
ncbi:MAG TPA: energy transducer TonB [Pyrinomonadaceae bacterium]|nr:energy transducer TonB [Pyrinomonadaceae bacterium]